jgi:hypothetical protein
LPVVLDLDLPHHALALHDGEAVGMDEQVVHLGGVAVVFQPDAVEHHDLRVIGKEALQVEGHLLFGRTAGAGKLVFGGKGIEFFVDHGRGGMRIGWACLTV